MIDHIQLISVGDMIEAINGQSLLGCRHYEVARLLKELPRGRTFTLKLTEPRKAFGEEAPTPDHRHRPIRLGLGYGGRKPPAGGAQAQPATVEWGGSPALPWGGGAGSPPSPRGPEQGGSCPHTQLPGTISPAKRPQPW